MLCTVSTQKEIIRGLPKSRWYYPLKKKKKRSLKRDHKLPNYTIWVRPLALVRVRVGSSTRI